MATTASISLPLRHIRETIITASTTAIFRTDKVLIAKGELVDADTFSQAGPTPEAFSQVFAPGEMTDGEAHTAWTVELGRTAQGELVALFLSRFGDEVGRAACHQAHGRHRRSPHLFCRLSEW